MTETTNDSQPTNSSLASTNATTTTDPTTETETTQGTSSSDPSTSNPSTSDPTTDPSGDPTTEPTTDTSETTDPITTDPTDATDSTATTEPNVCGNGVVENDEQCDGGTLPIKTCKSYDNDKYGDGDLSCTLLCKYNFSDCVKLPCGAPENYVPCDADSPNFEHAFGVNCYEVDANKWGPDNSLYASDFQLISSDPSAYRVVKQFGTYYEGNKPYWSAREGDYFVLLSNGKFPDVDLNGILTAPPGSAQSGGNTNNNNPSNLMTLPGDMSWMKGSNDGQGGTPFMGCDLINDCSDTLDAQWNLGPKLAHDMIYLELTITAPAATFGFEFDFAFFSAEYPEYAQGGEYNDMAIVWVNGESYTGNVTFIIDENMEAQPLTVTALTANNLIKFGPSDPHLNGTGYDGVGGATEWIRTVGPVLPHETITVSFTVFDKVDAEINTALALDNFHWNCGGCDLVNMTGCGIIE